MIYTIFDGVNGAGKSTMCQLLSEKEKGNLGIRINVDDLVATMGNWQDAKIQTEASREIVAKIKYCLNNNKSFNQENTLSGKSIVYTIKLAKTKGYVVNLNYVFVNNAEIAKTRVRERIEQGGHGVPDELIERRFITSLSNLELILPLWDTVNIFNNTDNLLSVVIIKKEQIIYLDKNVPEFISRILPL